MMKSRKICIDAPKKCKNVFEHMLSCDFCLLHVNSNQFQQKSISRKYRQACTLRAHLVNFQKYFQKCKHLKNNPRKSLRIKMFIVCTTPVFALEFQCTLGDKHQQQKLPCMLCNRLAYILHSFSHEPCKVKMQCSKITPKNSENLCEYKTYLTCVSNWCLLAHQLQVVLLDKDQQKIAICLLCVPKQHEKYKNLKMNQQKMCKVVFVLISPCA